MEEESAFLANSDDSCPRYLEPKWTDYGVCVRGLFFLEGKLRELLPKSCTARFQSGVETGPP